MSSSKHPLWAVLRREVTRIRQNPAYRFLLFFGPLTGILLMYFIFRNSTVKEIPIAIVDKDHSTLSVKIGNAIEASPDVDVVFHPDASAFDPGSPYYDPASSPQAPRWYCVDVRLIERLRRPITLAGLKRCPALADFALLRRGNRLSVLAVSAAQWACILDLAAAPLA